MMSSEFPIPSMHLLCFFLFSCHYNKIKSRKTSPPYRVLLHNDNYNKPEYDVQVLMDVMPRNTLNTIVNVLPKSHYNGITFVVIFAQVDAKEHYTQLQGNNLVPLSLPMMVVEYSSHIDLSRAMHTMIRVEL